MIEIRTLAGCRDFEVSLSCLQSLLRAWDGAITLNVFCDGTLSPEMRQRLHGLGNVQITDLQGRDAILPGLLERFPLCREFRRRHFLAQKLFDIVLLPSKNGNSIHYCDSDIYWVTRVVEAFESRESGPRAVFAQDTIDAYSLRFWNFLSDTSLRPVSSLNAGIISCHKDVLDLEYIEWLLAKPAVQGRFMRSPHWAEQSCWALLAARTDSVLIRREVVSLVTRHTLEMKLEGIAAFHLVSSYRGLFQDLLRLLSGTIPTPGAIRTDVSPVTIPAQPVGIISQLLTEFRLRFGH